MRAGPRVAVIGGGLSGLTAAYQLTQDLPGASVTIHESSARVGGALETVDFPSGPMELGAEAFVRRRPEALDLIRDLGMADDLRSPGGRGSAILTGGRAVPVPSGTLMGLPSDPGTLVEVLSPDEVARATEEEHRPLEWTPGGDVSLGGIVAQRFGPAVVTRLVDPMLGGVYAAPSAGLGLREVVPGLAAELDRGAPTLTAAVRTLLGRGTSGPVFATPLGGYRRLVGALVDASGAEVRTRSTAVALVRDGGGYSVTSEGPQGTGTQEVDLVVVAVPVPRATRLVAADPVLAAALAGLDGIRTASSAVVALEVDRSFELPEYSGVLVATDEPVPFKAMTFSSRKWPHLDDRPGHLVRVSFGRLDDDEVLTAGDDALTGYAVTGLGELADSTPRILHSRVRRWDGALAEIGPGHRDRIATVRAELTGRAPGVELVGGVTEGVGVPACIGSARAAARRLSEKWQD